MDAEAVRSVRAKLFDVALRTLHLGRRGIENGSGSFESGPRSSEEVSGVFDGGRRVFENG